MLDEWIKVPSLKSEDDKNHLIVRQKIIDSAEGRLLNVVEEFEKAFDILGKYEKTVTVFGSARSSEDHPFSKQAFAAGWALSKHGYTVVTGGGGGVMQAANKGAIQAGGASIGFNIHLPMEQKLNDFTTESYRFEHFFGRKVAMTLDASAFVFAGGGFGTLDELFEILTLVQTGVIPKVPIILLGKDFWQPFDTLITKMLDETFHTIEPDDHELYIITDDMKELISVIDSADHKEAREEMFKRAHKLKDRWVEAGHR